jgi:quercetin 2,3-dioxygenase
MENPAGCRYLYAIKKSMMANTIIHRANTRGHANHGWLNSYHTFSFGSYHHPERIHFGALRVLNDDTVKGGMGFGTHPHQNMEIISIPLEGELEHKDSIGNTAVIKKGDVQVMSAGTGVYHSEKNKNANETVKFLQIWVFPNQQNVTPRYGQVTLHTADRHNTLQQVLSPNPNGSGVWIYQDAWFYMGNLDKDIQVNYTLHKTGNGVYAFIIKGDVTINGHAMNERDGIGIWEVTGLEIKANSDAEILLMEVPMFLT